MAGILSNIQIRAVCWIEVYYNQNSGRFPPVEKILAEFPDLDIEDFLSDELVSRALHNRGITRRRRKSITDEQAAAILTVANYDDRRPIPAKLKSLGIPVTRWNGWKKDYAFRNFLHSQIKDSGENSLDRVWDGLLKAVDKGDVAAIKYYMELTGRTPSTSEMNFKLAVSRIIESVTRHVSDPDKIRAIGRDFEMIMAGQDPNIITLAPSRPSTNPPVEEELLPVEADYDYGSI